MVQQMIQDSVLLRGCFKTIEGVHLATKMIVSIHSAINSIYHEHSKGPLHQPS